MSAEVVHDDPYAAYLAGLSELDKVRRVPKRLEVLLPIVVVVTFFVGVFVVDDTVWGFALIIIPMLFIVLGTYRNVQLTDRYQDLGKKYLPDLIPDAYREYSLSIEFESRTRVKIMLSDGFTLYCGLRKLSETKGEEGWIVGAPAATREGSYSDVRIWAERMMIARKGG